MTVRGLLALPLLWGCGSAVPEVALPDPPALPAVTSHVQLAALGRAEPLVMATDRGPSIATPHEVSIASDFPGARVVDFETASDDSTLRADFGGIAWDADWFVYHAIAGNYEARSGQRFVTNKVKPSTPHAGAD